MGGGSEGSLKFKGPSRGPVEVQFLPLSLQKLDEGLSRCLAGVALPRNNDTKVKRADVRVFLALEGEMYVAQQMARDLPHNSSVCVT